MKATEPKPDGGLVASVSRWLKTTGGIVLMLLAVQFATGLFLAFYYVPSIDHAHTTVAFIEKVLSSGSWLRSLHHYGSQWLSLFVFLHLISLLVSEAYKNSKAQWITAVALLILVMAGGATGYSLPWDARAFFSTRVAEGLAGGLPFIGKLARLWLLAGNNISTLTLSRLFALHVLVTPFFILALVGWRISKQVESSLSQATISRNVIAATVVFVALAVWALKTPAPLGPSITQAGSNYLPRPGAQFVWLYQSLKYVPGGLGSIVGVVVPLGAILTMLALPWLDTGFLRRLMNDPRRKVAVLLLAIAAVWIGTMSVISYLSDRGDPKVREQLARQRDQERAFRQAGFEPVRLLNDDRTGSQSSGAPTSYVQFCANCHGQRGEGGSQGTLKFPPLLGVGSKPRRSVTDIVGILNEPTAYGLEPPMRSFATKLTEQEKQEIAEWIVTLK